MDENLVQAEAFPLATPQPPKRDMHWVFVGAEGLRAGWGVLLFVLLFIGFSFLSIQVLKHLLPPSHHSAVFPLRLAFISEGAQLVPLLLATAIMALIERRPLLAYGYQGTSKSGALHFRLGLGIRRPFRVGACLVEGRAACLRRSTVARRRRLEVRPGLGLFCSW